MYYTMKFVFRADYYALYALYRYAALSMVIGDAWLLLRRATFALKGEGRSTSDGSHVDPYVLSPSPDLRLRLRRRLQLHGALRRVSKTTVDTSSSSVSLPCAITLQRRSPRAAHAVASSTHTRRATLLAKNRQMSSVLMRALAGANVSAKLASVSDVGSAKVSMVR